MTPENEKKPDTLFYNGSYQPDEMDQAIRKKHNRTPLSPYLPSPDLVQAVELAIFLKRPLLLRGEPGCGKSRLAEAVAFELAKRNGVEDWPYEFWPVKSTSRARDGLYTFDAVSRLREAQLAAARAKAGDETAVLPHDRENLQQYVKDGPLGRAFKSKRRAIVLIDEIDKADIDFPNDLLIELEERRFKIDELSRFREDGTEEEEWVKAESEPIIFITSNHEKELPDAFLRRCVFFYIEFPDETLLQNIVTAHCLPAQPTEEEQELVKQAVARFISLRRDLEQMVGEAGKLVSTSELIDWVKVLLHHHRDNLAEAFTLLADTGRLPYRSVLLKNKDISQKYGESAPGNQRS
jgi:MoxR-like ATPase